MSNIEEGIDINELKVIDEQGEAQPVEVSTKEPQEENTNQEETQEVNETPAEETEAVETKSEDVAEEPEALLNEDSSKDEAAPAETGKITNSEELFNELDKISTELSDGKANTLEEFFEEFRRMRDSSQTQFKDDFIKNAVEYYNKNGTLTPYLEATSVNYEELSDEQIMRRELEQNNPTLSKKALDRLYQRDIVNKYNLDLDKFDEEEVELGKELLKADASKLRSKYVDEQKNFTQPPKSEETEESSVDQEEIMQKWAETVTSNQTTKDVLDNKRILVEYGDDKFSYEIENPEELKEMTLDNNKFFNLFRDESGNIDFDKWYKVLAYALDPEVYDSSLISHGQELGQEKVVSDLKNPTKPTKSSQEYRTPSNPIEGLIGALSRGDSDIKIIR